MRAASQHKPFSFLVLSDIHFGQLSVSPEFRLDGASSTKVVSKRPSLKEGLVSTVSQLDERPTAILVPGDLTSIASPGEFKGCVEIVYEIAHRLEISNENVFFTLGNHDTNWRICELSKATDKFPCDSVYNHLAASVGSIYVPMNGCLEEGPVFGSGVFRSGENTLFVLNSGIFCTSDQEYKHGKIGKEQLSWFERVLPKLRSDTGWNILMIHHHAFNYKYPNPEPDISCIEEGAELIDVAGRQGIDILCHGHRHHPQLFTDMRSGWKYPLTMFCAGSFAVNAHHRDTGLIPNLFHVVTLKDRLPNGSAFGRVISYEFTTEGWYPVMNKASTPLDHIHWFGSTDTEEECFKAAKEYLASMVSGANKFPVMLDSRESLPSTLICCSLSRLNLSLKRAAQQLSLRIIGEYPNDIGVLKH